MPHTDGQPQYMTVSGAIFSPSFKTFQLSVMADFVLQHCEPHKRTDQLQLLCRPRVTNVKFLNYLCLNYMVHTSRPSTLQGALQSNANFPGTAFYHCNDGKYTTHAQQWAQNTRRTDNYVRK